MSRVIFYSLIVISMIGCSSTVEHKPVVHEVTAEQLFQEALLLHEQKEFQLAIGKYGEALQKDPAYLKARIYQAGCHFSIGKYEECQVNVAHIINDPSFNSLNVADRADTYRLQGQLYTQQAIALESQMKKQALLREAQSNFDMASDLEER